MRNARLLRAPLLRCQVEWGPMTIAMLMANTVVSAYRSAGKNAADILTSAVA